MAEIFFTQFLQPDGRRRDTWINRPAEIVALADQIIAAGYRFESEMLHAGQISLTITNDEGDQAIEVVPNGPEVPLAVDRMVKGFAEHLAKVPT